VHLAGMTPNPDGRWMAQIARNMSMIFAEEKPESRPTHIIRDRDTKFTAQFCSILETDGIEFRPTPRRSPNLNPFAEAWVQKTKHEVLDHFIVFGETHLRTILSDWLTYYHFRRPHQGLANVLISGEALPEISIDDFRRENVVPHETLGGLLKYYERKAA
jgi:putative transposase